MNNKGFKGYPIRQIRMSDKEWASLKLEKLKSAKTWNNFIKEILLKNNNPIC